MPPFPPPKNPNATKDLPIHERPRRPISDVEAGGTDEGHGPPDHALEAQAQAILAKAGHDHGDPAPHGDPTGGE